MKPLYRMMRKLAFFLCFCVCLSLESSDDKLSASLHLGIWYEDGIHPLMVEWVPNTYGTSGKLLLTLQPDKYSRNLPTFNLLPTATDGNKRESQVNMFMSSFGMLTVATGLGCFLLNKLRAMANGIKRTPLDGADDDQVHFRFTRYTFDTVAAATHRFSDQNKIGEGGFGPVYKGLLPNGIEIAVKRMSFDHGQGVDEFRNEVISLAKLQHRNLVKLLGFCTHKRERILIYQFMPNKSLDYHLFDRSRRSLMSWTTRSSIIKGIARGLLYLHEDSIPTIIHRDVKASNVLLDDEMIPKISDFGLARIKGDRTEMMTERVIGTEGYIAPEYRNLGTYSDKSDVFSFGVLALEIISGRRNRDNSSINLIQQAWKLYGEGELMQLVDPNMASDASSDGIKIKRCIQVCLLCIQQNAAQRPKMSVVVCLLSDETTFMPQPNPPPGTTTQSNWRALYNWLQNLRGRGSDV